MIDKFGLCKPFLTVLPLPMMHMILIIYMPILHSYKMVKEFSLRVPSEDTVLHYWHTTKSSLGSIGPYLPGLDEL